MSDTAPLLVGTPCLDFVNTATTPPSLASEGELRPSQVARLNGFRVVLRRILEGEATGRGAPPGDLDLLNRILSRAGARRGLLATVRGYGWGWLDSDRGGLERLLWPLAFSAARLLSGPDLDRLKACGGCGRLFLDGSRNRSRRWCDMQGCGNREKQRRFRAHHPAG